jgi:hypothetical protein
MVAITNNIGNPLYSIDWEEGIVNITRAGVDFFLNNPDKLLSEQPKGIKFRNESQKMYEYLKYKKLLD